MHIREYRVVPIIIISLTPKCNQKPSFLSLEKYVCKESDSHLIIIPPSQRLGPSKKNLNLKTYIYLELACLTVRSRLWTYQYTFSSTVTQTDQTQVWRALPAYQQEAAEDGRQKGIVVSQGLLWPGNPRMRYD